MKYLPTLLKKDVLMKKIKKHLGKNSCFKIGRRIGQRIG